MGIVCMCNNDEGYEFLKRQAEEGGLQVEPFFESLKEKYADADTDLDCNQKKIILLAFLQKSRAETVEFLDIAPTTLAGYCSKG
ncbi:MAG: hypothetical protein AAF063_30635, partial [Cyanobacteria bacterium J06643_5]